jgi:hypothetical protein
MIGFFRQLLAAPLRLLLWLLGFVPVIDRRIVSELIWRISGDPADGNSVVVLTAQKKGIIAARQKADAILNKTQDALIATTMGFVEIHLCNDISAANGWIYKAKEQQCKNTELLLRLKLLLSDVVEEYNTTEIVDEILSRNDLPMDYTRTALIVRIERFLGSRLWDEADEVLDRMLCIEENYEICFPKWVTCMAKDDHVQAELYLKKMKNKVPEGQLRLRLATGWIYLGDKNRAMQCLKMAERAGMKATIISQSNRKFGEIIDSQEYKKLVVQEY